MPSAISGGTGHGHASHPRPISAAGCSGRVGLAVSVACSRPGSPGEVRLWAPVESSAVRVVVATEGPAAARLLSSKQIVSPTSKATFVVPLVCPPQPPCRRQTDHPRRHADRPSAQRGCDEQRLARTTAPSGSSSDPPGALHQQRSASWRGLSRRRSRPAAPVVGSAGRRMASAGTDTIAHGQPDSQPPFTPKKPVALGDGLFVCGDHRDTPVIPGPCNRTSTAEAGVCACLQLEAFVRLSSLTHESSRPHHRGSGRVPWKPVHPRHALSSRDVGRAAVVGHVQRRRACRLPGSGTGKTFWRRWNLPHS